MKTIDKKTIIIAGATLIIGLLAGWLIFGVNRSNSHDDHEQDKTEIHADIVWTCSMHPQVRQNEPGSCPICGMDLIPLEDDPDDDSDPMSIRMSPAAMQLAGVTTAIVGRTEPVKQLQLNGKVQIDERRVNSQSSHTPGRIEKLLVNFTGEFVNRGQTVAYIYSPELVTAQEELLEAQKIAESQPQLFSAAKWKLRNWKLSDSQIENILNSGEIMKEFPIKADVSGYVTSKMKNSGDYVSGGETIYEITDLSVVWVQFDLYESDISLVNIGDPVEFSIYSIPGESFQGTISFIDPLIDPVTRVAKARIEYKNTRGELKPEMFVSGVIEAELAGKSNSLVVPKTAVMWTGKRSVAYVKTASEQGVRFTMREISLGLALGDSYLIESGLEEGEEIAVHGTFSIDAAAQLAGKPSMMNPEGGKVMTGHSHGDMEMGGVETEQRGEEIVRTETAQHLSIDSQAKEALQPLFVSYLNWKDALTNDEFQEAQEMATSMVSALEKVNMSLFKGDAHNVWMDFQDSLNKSLEHVQHYSDIEQLRKAFQTVSATMIEMAERFTPLEETIYVQHCPMADDNKGADWLSMEREIRNPYFGSSMLKCGEITKEIKF